MDTLYRFDLRSRDGYTIRVAPVEHTFMILESRFASLKYQAEFYKPGETKPFETVVSDQTFDPRAAPYETHTPYARLDISFDRARTSPQAAIETITPKMNDPKTTQAERNVLLVSAAGKSGGGAAEEARGDRQGPPDRSGEPEQRAG